MAAGPPGMCGGASPTDLAKRLNAARALLRSAWPDAVEREAARGAARMLLYAPPTGGPALLRLVVESPNVLLHFAEGARLPDPAGLLRGEGRRGRYVCLGALKTGDQPALRTLIAAATLGS